MTEKTAAQIAQDTKFLSSHFGQWLLSEQAQGKSPEKFLKIQCPQSKSK